tara:strand:- start:632 stop:1456 length:825 start_codon:yes stop_codon:yes gene_type:complete
MIDSVFDLSGKIIVITGSVGLLGKKHVEAVLEYGGLPILVDISEEKLLEQKDKIAKEFNVDTMICATDITNEDQVKLSSERVFKEYGKIDGLVNNAANNPKVEDSKADFSRLENFPLDIWNNDIAVGLTGSFLCSKHFGAFIAKNKDGGSIVNISSDLGLIAPDQNLYRKNGLEDSNQPVKPVTYSVIKSGIIGLTRYLSTYWTEEGVRCNAICPGGIKNGQSESFLQEVSKRIPMKRLANSDEYKGTLIWMLSSGSSYLNGAIVPVDGGRTAW